MLEISGNHLATSTVGGTINFVQNASNIMTVYFGMYENNFKTTFDGKKIFNSSTVVGNLTTITNTGAWTSINPYTIFVWGIV